MEYKDNQIMEIEELFIDDSTVQVHTENQDFEVELDGFINNLVSIVGNQITYNDYHFYEIRNEINWNDKYGNEESEFEEFEIELSIVSQALLMSGSLKAIETV